MSRSNWWCDGGVGVGRVRRERRRVVGGSDIHR